MTFRFSVPQDGGAQTCPFHGGVSPQEQLTVADRSVLSDPGFAPGSLQTCVTEGGLWEGDMPAPGCLSHILTGLWLALAS